MAWLMPCPSRFLRLRCWAISIQIMKSLVSGRFQGGKSGGRALQECCAFCFEGFQVRSEVLIVPSHGRANAQGGLAAAGFRPARAERNRNAAEQYVGQSHGKLTAIGFNYFGHDVRGMRTNRCPEFGADQSYARDLHGPVPVPFHQAASRLLTDRTRLRDL